MSALHGHDFAWLLFMDPPRHTKLRAIISKFTSRAIAALEPRIRELSRQLLDAAVARGQLDLVADYGTPLPLMVIAELLGVLGRHVARSVEYDHALGRCEPIEEPPRQRDVGHAIDAGVREQCQ